MFPKVLSFLFIGFNFAIYFLQFAVLKFLTHEGRRLTPDDDVFYAGCLTRWFTTELDENMEVQIKWPPKPVDAGSLVTKEKPPDLNWGEKTVMIKRFYGK